MSHLLRFCLLLIIGLALLTWTASLLVGHTMRTWFHRDLGMRARLAVNSAKPALLFYWQNGDREAIRHLLSGITRDERIVAAAACGPDESVVATPEYPAAFSCASIRKHVMSDGAVSTESAWQEWTSVEQAPHGKFFLSAVPIHRDTTPVGFVVLVHDLTYVDSREARTQKFLIIAFGILALGGALVSVLAARFSWRGWTEEVRRVLKGGRYRPDFQPILRDVLDLVDRLVMERDSESQSGAWSPQRLKHVLERHYHGESLVVVGNREPYIHDRSKDGSINVLHPASGLVTALEPVIRACSGVWVAHGGGSADRETVDAHGRIRVPPGQESYVLRRVWLEREQEQGYYYGFSNEGLWPLCHLAHTRPIFRTDDFRHYQSVNAKFVEAILEEVQCDNPVILVQDYHFALVPRLLRARLPRSTIITFWHIPWPNAERFGICPWHDELLDGMLGSSILGFHTQAHCNDFIETVDRYLEARIDRERFAVVQQKTATLIRPYPISIEWPSQWASTAASCEDCRSSVFSELGLDPGMKLGVGVDRLDYIKGIEERLLAVERLLERSPAWRGRFTFVQLAAPSRTLIDSYRELNDSVEAVAARINERFSQGTYRPIILLRSHHEPPRVFRFYRAADLCYVSSLHDGMNLVAKEFVAAREDEAGVLVLSQFTGAARELTEALIVNPYDIEQASAALEKALEMPADEQRARMRAMRGYLAEFNVYRWAGRMLIDASRLRRKESLGRRLGDMLTGD